MRGTKLSRRIRRAANKLVIRRRYREKKRGVLANVWTIRIGPAAPSEKVAKRKENS